MTSKLLLASGNRKKARELFELLEPLGIGLVSPADVGGLPEVIEDGDSFRANAEKKATSGAQASGLWTLADDSGLEVDHLDGAPGIHSARFSGEDATDEKNNALLLEKLDGLPADARTARFRCALALAEPSGLIVAHFDGSCEGRIIEEARGSGGFGYDPLFLFTEEGHEQCGKIFAELSSTEKADVSHRGRALQDLARNLPTLLAP